MSSTIDVGTSGIVYLSLDCDTKNLVSRWGETLDFSEDEENMVSITEDDDVHLLDVDDVDILKIVTTEGNSLNVEDDVWIAVVARLGLVNEQLVWGFVQTELIV
ncbi:hypothetical protein V6N13_074629 [Hibiscus sabdariffa]